MESLKFLISLAKRHTVRYLLTNRLIRPDECRRCVERRKGGLLCVRVATFEQVACCLTTCNFLTDDSQCQLKNADVFFYLFKQAAIWLAVCLTTYTER